MKELHPELVGMPFYLVLDVLGFKNYNEYHEQYEKNYKRSRTYARSSSGFRSTRPLALKRDGHRCVVCQQPSRTVHHVDEFRDTQDSNIDNLVTLCALHHAAAHGRMDRS